MLGARGTGHSSKRDGEERELHGRARVWRGGKRMEKELVPGGCGRFLSEATPGPQDREFYTAHP